jgi:hypothetical protein
MINDDELYDLIKHNTKNYKNIRDRLDNLSKNAPMLAIVLEVSSNKTSRDTYYGFGSVRVFAPELVSSGMEDVWAIPKRGSFGSMELPKPGYTVTVYSIGDVVNNSVIYYYENSAPADGNPYIHFLGYGDYINPEPIGFTFKPSIRYKGYIGGRYSKYVMENPGEAKIVSSTNTFVFYQSDKDKKIELKGADDYTTNLQVGDNGKINIGYVDETTDAVQTGSADLDVDLGINGDAIIQTIRGNVNIKVSVSTGNTNGYIKMQAGSNSITISANGIHIVGNTYISGLAMISQEVHWNTGGFPPTGYIGAQANRGTTHIHPGGTGPSGPPQPGS